MKKIIALIAAVALVLSLSACFMPNANNNSDSSSEQANAADVTSYDKDFDGLVKYITDRGSNYEKMDIYYDLLGADNGARIVLNKNAFVEVYDFSGVSSATADSANASKAKDILNAVRENGKFKPIEDGAELTAAITDSGKYVLAWDASRSFDYTGKVVDHIWNKVVCGGEWFVVDVTWDDPVGNDQVLRYDYFLIDDATSARSLTTTSNRFMNAPAALNAYGDFYSRNGLVIDYNSDIYYQFNNLLTSQMTDGWKDIALDFRCLDQNLFNQIKQEYFTVLADGGKGFDNVLRDQFMEPGEAIKYTCSENENVYSYHITVSKGNDQITEGNTNAN